MQTKLPSNITLNVLFLILNLHVAKTNYYSLCLIIHILEASLSTAAAWPEALLWPWLPGLPLLTTPFILITLVRVCRVAWKSQGHFLLKLFSAPSIPRHLLQTLNLALESPASQPPTLHLDGPWSLSKAGSRISWAPSSSCWWHSAMRPGHQRPLCHWQRCGCRPGQASSLVWSSGFQGDRANSTTGRAGRESKEVWSILAPRTTRHWISLSSCLPFSASDDSGFSLFSSVRRSQDGAYQEFAAQFRATWNHSTECCHWQRGSDSGISAGIHVEREVDEDLGPLGEAWGYSRHADIEAGATWTGVRGERRQKAAATQEGQDSVRWQGLNSTKPSSQWSCGLSGRQSVC